MDNKGTPIGKKITLMLSGVMIMVFFGLGFFILFNEFPVGSPQTSRIIFACVLFAYGLFRGYRVYRSYRNES